MSPIWALNTASASRSFSAACVEALLEVASAPPSAERLLRAIATLVPVEYLSWVHIERDLPVLTQGCSQHRQDRDVVAECFAIYRRSYFRSDAVMPLAHRMTQRPVGEAAALRCRAEDLPVPGWRDDIYVRERLTDRFSLLHASDGGVVEVMHFYRDERQGAFQSQEIEQLLAFAPLLQKAHLASLQVALREPHADPVGRARDRLLREAPQLSPRETEVVARLACGWSADGVAADLDVAPSTVATLRKRAYLKLAERGQPAQRLRLARWLS
ncbi:LuxR C-terminal-related transcriptional regulator [Hydrogenophaga sp.]|uniref:helix-turn-helix transcriptional regulator n=1 Tax=Hydrogenophaga sp. TaxID=1904254 RepID=UPI0025BE9867|nr:LuxR C-terminal-related transcriptional regulator [Hydrogenophaga sp.]